MRAKFLYNIVMFGENKLLDKVKKDCLAYANLSLEEKDMFPTQELEAHRQRCEEIRRNREFKDDESLD
uniref:Uncharacterized protein n=1 Tax=Kalanchoe fedtschenkoi TaxID=63787 RepID=A0A7N0UUV0_KALFE